MSTVINSELFNFFRELKQNNNKTWFQENKNRYETFVREPLLQFITEFGTYLQTISKNILADPRKTGGMKYSQTMNSQRILNWAVNL